VGIPVIVVTSEKDKFGDDNSAQLSGADSYLSRPVTDRSLKECLARALMMSDQPCGLETDPGTTSDGAESQPSSIRILIAEDIYMNQFVLSGLLTKMGCVVDFASDGHDAVAACQKKHFDLILMDCQMPNMDGFDATRKIRQAKEGKNQRTPIVAVTAHTEAGDRERCLDAGMNDYITKPVKPVVLQKMLENWVIKTSDTCQPEA
jgi:CheY-like chemotaxis protein